MHDIYMYMYVFGCLLYMFIMCSFVQTLGGGFLNVSLLNYTQILGGNDRNFDEHILQK